MRETIACKKRRIIQLLTAVIYNFHFKGFLSASIYDGSLKALCVPGLNCYSCPGAVAACPLGSLQSELGSLRFGGIPYYILGMLIMFGVLLGRAVCGFLCPFGLIEELLYKVPTRKIKKSAYTRRLSNLKYLILVFMVFFFPLALSEPGFCKYICPAGTLEAGLPLVLMRDELKALTGLLYSWKLVVLAMVLILCIYCYRSFCRFICPLGALYSLFNPISFCGIDIDTAKCTDCKACLNICKMDIKKPGDRECIQCGECIDACSFDAISALRRGLIIIKGASKNSV